MHCLASFCYVCLEKKDKLLSNINSSLNKDIIHIIGSLPYNLGWLKTLQIILICEECCLRLRENYQFQEKCLKNSAVLQTYMNKLNTTSISNTGNVAELVVKLNVRHKDIIEVKCEIGSEDEELYTIQWQQNIAEIGDVFVDFEDSLIKEGIICKKEVDDKSDNNSTEITEETEDVFANAEDYFVKEENTWKREKVDDWEEYPTDNNSTENMDQESDSEISVSDKAHLTNTDGVSSEFTCKQAHTTNKNDLNTAAKKSFKCSTCSKYFVTKSALNIHTRIHRNEKLYECAICKKRFGQKVVLVIHMRLHTGEKPYSCTTCKKRFTQRQNLVSHMKVHTGEKPYNCTTCKKSFARHQYLVSHMRVHTGEKPYSCTTCKKPFTQNRNLITHMRIHTGEKPYSCTTCKKSFAHNQNLITHKRIHSGERPYKCLKCKKCFTQQSNLTYHMRVHTNEKPYSCSKCKKCFAGKSTLVRHMRIHADKKSQE